MKVKGKGKGHPRTDHENPEGEQIYSSTLSLTSALDADGWSTSRPGRFNPRKGPAPIEWEAEWAPGPVGMGVKNLSPIGIRSPARSELLYRLRYPCPHFHEGNLENEVFFGLNLKNSAMEHAVYATFRFKTNCSVFP